MPAEEHLVGISRTIQLAVAPVFLLTALGTILGVLSTRLGRVVDRVRVLSAKLPGLAAPDAEPLRAELALLSRRRRLVNHAITCAVIAALLVCLVIAVAFVGFTFGTDYSLLMAWLFVAAMAAFIGALLLFLLEIFLTVQSVRVNPGGSHQDGNPK
jgi:MFS family permease